MNRRDLGALCVGALGAGAALRLLPAPSLWRTPATTATLIGDSTVANRPGDTCLMMGWGRKLAELAYPRLRVINRARAGSTCSGFLGNDWPGVRESLRPDGLLLIQFGHVDSRRGPAAQAAYRPSLQRLASEALAAGTRPLLCTPIASWAFTGSQWTYAFEPFATEVRAVGAEMGLPVLDLGLQMGAEMNARGAAASRALFMLTHDGQDHIHLTAAGASLAAQLVLRQLALLGLYKPRPA